MPRASDFLIIAGRLASASSALAQEVAFPEGDGKPIVETVCGVCHALTFVKNAGYSRADWQVDVNAMLHRGAPLTPDQVPVVVDYLAKNFPAKPLPPTPTMAQIPPPPPNVISDLSGY